MVKKVDIEQHVCDNGHEIELTTTRDFQNEKAGSVCCKEVN